MTTTVHQDGITYVERDYKCVDCDFTWTLVAVKGSNDLPKCPNCQNADRTRFSKPRYGEEIKTKVGKRKPKVNPDIKPGMPAYNTRASSRKKAANLAYEECQKQGFTDMKDSGLRNGDICAPPLNSLVATIQDRMGGGWTGAGTTAYNAPTSTDAGGKAALASLQGGIMNGQLKDNIGGIGSLKK